MTQIQTQNGFSKVQGDSSAYNKNTEAPASAASGQAPASNDELLIWLEQTALPYYQALMSGQVQASPEELAQLEQWIAWANEQLVASGQTGFDLPQDYQNSYAGSPSGLPPEPNGLRPGMGEFYVANNQENSLYMTFPDASNSYPTYVWGDSADIFSNQSDVEITYEHGKDPLTDQACMIVKVTSPSTGQTKTIYVMEAESKINIHAVHSDRKVKAVGDGNFANVHIEEFKAEAVQENQNPNTPDRKEGETEIYDRAQLDYFVNNCGSGTAYIYGSEINFVDVPPSAKINVENTKMPEPDGREAIKATITLSDGTTKVVYILKKPGQVISWHYVTEDQFMGTVDANKLKNLQKYGNQQNAIEFRYHGGAAAPAADTPATGHAGDTVPNIIGNHAKVGPWLNALGSNSPQDLEGTIANYNSYFNVTLHASFGETRLHMIQNAEVVDIYPQSANDIIETHMRANSMIVTIYKNGDRNQPEVFMITPPKKVNIHSDKVTYKDEKSEIFFKSQTLTPGGNNPDRFDGTNSNEALRGWHYGDPEHPRNLVTLSHNDGKSETYIVHAKSIKLEGIGPNDSAIVSDVGGDYIKIEVQRADGTTDTYQIYKTQDSGVLLFNLDFGSLTKDKIQGFNLLTTDINNHGSINYSGKAEADAAAQAEADAAAAAARPIEPAIPIDATTMNRAEKLAAKMGININVILGSEEALQYLKSGYPEPTEEFIAFLVENDPQLSILANNPALAATTENTMSTDARKKVNIRMRDLMNAAMGDKYSYCANAGNGFNTNDDFWIKNKDGTEVARFDIIDNTSGEIRFAQNGVDDDIDA